MQKSREASTEELKAKFGTFLRAVNNPHIWNEVEPVGHACADASGYVVELSMVRRKRTPRYFVLLTAAHTAGEEPLAVLDLEFTLDAVACNEEILTTVAAGVAQQPALIAELLAQALEADLNPMSARPSQDWSLPN